MTHYYYVSYKCFSFAQELTDKTEVWSENVLHLYNSTQHFCVPSGCTETHQNRHYQNEYKQLEYGDFSICGLQVFAFSTKLLSLFLDKMGLWLQNYFCQQMHCLLKHKMLQFVLKISLFWFLHVSVSHGPSSGSIRWSLAKVTVSLKSSVKTHR